MWLNFLIFITVIGYSFSDSINAKFSNQSFPKDFKFNAATAAYQVEGAWNEDGKGESIWDRYTHNNPNVGNADIACDSYHKFKEDVQMLKFLGVSQYKFSISWTRIFPNGFSNNISLKGVQYYKNLIYELKSNDIEPLVVMYHFDLPQTLQDLGGLTNESFVDWFSEYSWFLFKTFGNEVKWWVTFNEGWVICYIGYGLGLIAPSINGTGVEDYKCGHNIIKAHARAWHIYNEEFRSTQNGNISMAFAIDWYSASSNSTKDIAAAERTLEFYLGWFANPLFYGDYPDVMKKRIAFRSKLEGYQQSRLPEFNAQEKTYIRGTLDFFSLQTYNAFTVNDVDEPEIEGGPALSKDLAANVTIVDSSEHGGKVIGQLINWISEKYDNPPIMITENGLGTDDPKLDDYDRINLIKSYLSTIRNTMNNGSNIIGYTVWALMDNFNWDTAYRVKFGLYHVDFGSANRTRTPRKSAYFYKNLIKTRCLVEHCI